MISIHTKIMLLTLLFSSGWEHFMLQVWWVWTFCVSWPRCTSSAGQLCPVTFLMSESSRPHGPTTSTWLYCCLCFSSACCLWSTPSWPCLRPSTVGHSGQLETIEMLHYNDIWIIHMMDTFYPKADTVYLIMYHVFPPVAKKRCMMWSWRL